MAPISDKRPRNEVMNPLNDTRVPAYGQTRMHNVTHKGDFAKENMTSAKHMKRGLEILDFRESWLEEMKLYKDNLNHQHSKHYERTAFGSRGHSNHDEMQSQLRAQQNHAKAHYHTNVKSRRHRNNTTEIHSTRIVSNQHNENIVAVAPNKLSPRRSPGQKRRFAEVRAAKIAAKNHIRNAVGYGINFFTGNKIIKHPATEQTNSQLFYKRPREETNMTVSTNNKTVPATVNGTTTPTTTTPITTSTTTSANNNNQGSKRQTVTTFGSSKTDHDNSTSKNDNTMMANGAKVIVNQFHASSLLNSFHSDDKTQLLTQNGLNKSAANAYEASYYANNYVTSSSNNPTTTYYGTLPNGDHNHYSGVLLANGDQSRKRLDSGNSEDPCGAIDEVTYTDSETEDEEYVGVPLHLKEDGSDTCQSRCIRHGPFFEDININLNKVDESSSVTIINEEKKAPAADNDDTSTIRNGKSVYYTPISILTPSLFPNVPPYLNFSSHAEKGPEMPAILHKVLKWKLSPVMPRIVKRVVLNSGFRIIKNTTDWMAVWEKHMKSPGFRTIRSHQKYNHMPGSFRIGRKDSMWRCIYYNMQKHGNKEFGFMQKSYIMPDDLEALRTSWPRNASKLTKWIVKPPASARGTGIRIVNKWSQFPKDRPLVVQKYIERPLLINDNKFDMRIYVVVTSINPLRIYMYKDGLARFAAVKYSSELNHLDDRCMHLTNYSINKLSQHYAKNEDINACQGHKWSLQSLWSCLEARGVNTKLLWATLRNLVIRAIISGESGLNRMYRQNVNFRYNCFELFGFDVLLDENLIPWLLEINISPSLHSELPLDLHVKGPLIQATLNTALYQVPPKLSEKQQREIMSELNLEKGPLCLDKRIYTTCLTAEEVRKHNHFTNRNVEFREEYLETIIDTLLPDDVRCLIVAEDELARCSPMERIFPTADTHNYLKYMENSRYYNRLLDAWENRYAHCRNVGIELLSGLCEQKFHLQVADAALEKEPNITLTDIDLLHTRKTDGDVITVTDKIYRNAVLASI